MSVSEHILSRVLGLLFIFCLTRMAAGSCLSYGHSCWGGHGKRSSLPRHPTAPVAAPSIHHTTDWYLSKLLRSGQDKPSELLSLFGAQDQVQRDLLRRRPLGYELYPVTNMRDGVSDKLFGSDSDTEPEIEEWAPETNESETEVLVVTPDEQIVPTSRLRLYQLMNQEGMRKQNIG